MFTGFLVKVADGSGRYSEELIIFKNIHDAIIDEETWNNAQRLKKTVRREVRNGTYKGRLTGLLYCAECGEKLSYRSPDSQRRQNGKTYDADNCFCCRSYRQLHTDCTTHYIKVSVVEELIKKTATVYTRDKVVMRKLDKLAADFPEVYKRTGQTDIDKTYSMPKSYVSYRKPRVISEVQRERARQMMLRGITGTKIKDFFVET